MKKDSSSLENTKNFQNKLLLHVVFYGTIVKISLISTFLVTLAMVFSIQRNYIIAAYLGCAYLLWFMVIGLASLLDLKDGRLEFLTKTVPKYIKNQPIEMGDGRYNVATYNPYRKIFYLEGDLLEMRELSERKVADYLVNTYCKDVYPFKNMLNRYLNTYHKYLKHL
ncbi:hypothetical protein UFOVP244_100 [uncultured Caudovirales phage]|uniref:Uncharacterized protein n=1 Tax=uncultured Caudovirales phage TaxID=2100421 RepID=A0A6J7WWZ1_9CAUD|nr:hypothetical protein UFOVP244_100 [uncultured Caudovirales phage]